MSRIRELAELKEALKKETSSEDASEARLVGIIQEIERCCEPMTRDAFIESKIGGSIKKVAESHTDSKAGSLAKELMEKWRLAFTKGSTTSSSLVPSTSSMASPRPVSAAKIIEIAKKNGPSEEKRQKLCTFLAEAFIDDLPHFAPDHIANICIAIEEALFNKISQDQYMTKGRSLRLSLAKHKRLRQQMLQGELSGENVVGLSSEELLPPEIKEAIEKGVAEIQEEKRSDWLDANREQFNKQAGIKEQGGMFKCGKCQSTKTAYYQKQTRSAE
jgi:DNA-directed RNA polymerase subunit M/transcription elongation factor TFIIS